MPGQDARARAAVLAVALLALIVLQPVKRVAARPGDVLPRTMLWAWERSSDLRDAPQDFGIAFLAQTISIDGDRVTIASRRWPLKVAAEAKLSAVTRIEMPANRVLTDADYDRIASAIAVTATYPQVVATQIDFDAMQSQRELYRRLIATVRRRLHADVPLSITALASWCAGDRWLDGLPIDEAVPMLFDMGPLDSPFRDIARDPATAHPQCRSSLGVALGDALPIKTKGRRVYVFNRGPWSSDALQAARELVER